MVLTLIRDLPGDRLDCPRFATTQTRCADVSTGTSGPHDFTSALACSSAHQVRCKTNTSIASPPRIVTTARTPLINEAGYGHHAQFL
jgi:hypothetical protein